ncbi:MAG: hypothetical protein RI953_578 [Pseudomonadota bacterium]|jgi:hypothetical protein
MLKLGFAFVGIIFSSQAFATSTYSCVSYSSSPSKEPPPTGSEAFTATWNVGTVSKLPSIVTVGTRPAVRYGQDGETAVVGFWQTEKRLWIELKGEGAAPSIILKTVNSNNPTLGYIGEARLSNGIIFPVKCYERG